METRVSDSPRRKRRDTLVSRLPLEALAQEAWTKENGQYVCGLHLWIRKRQWENVPEGDTPGAGCRKLSNEKGF
jgi:hypothetical protein